MPYDFEMNSEHFEKYCTSMKMPCEKTEKDLVKEIEYIQNYLTNYSENEKDYHTVIQKYSKITEIYVMLLNLSNNDTYAYLSGATIAYNDKSEYISKIAESKSDKDYEDVYLHILINYSNYMEFEFHKMAIIMRIKNNQLQDDTDMQNIYHTDAVSNYYYIGITDYVKKDYKLAIYYLYIAYYISKNNVKNSAYLYNRVCDMYDNAVNEKIDIKLYNSYKELKLLEKTKPNLIEKQKKANYEIAMKAILQSKTVLNEN